MSRSDLPADALAAPTQARVAPVGAQAQRRCRFCARSLSALERFRGDVCDAMDCRRRAADALTHARRQAELETARAQAALDWGTPALASAPLLWLKHHASAFAPPRASDVADLREALMALEDDPVAAAPVDDTEPAPGTALAAVGGHLCALCRGRCCRLGLRGNAFLAAGQLRDWLAGQPGASWADAVDHYLGFVGAEHLDQSCLFHGARGCTLPRERRSVICNSFACDTLQRLRDSATARPALVAVVALVQGHAMRSPSALSAEGVRALPDPREMA
jgi:hypothetical protein